MALVKHTVTPIETQHRCDDSPGGQERWIADLASDDSAIRRCAAQALCEIPDAVPVVCAHLANERSLSVRSIILTGLIINKSATVVAGLLPLLRSEDANLRNGAFEALQQMPDEVAPHADAMLDDPDSDVRIFAIHVLVEPRRESRRLLCS
jgi:HEAT repeat protein